jgi:S-adenosylmethionine hydrolase
VAAWLAGGGEPARLGPRVADPSRIEGLSAVRTAGGLEGACLAADPFGNLLTSVRRADLRTGSVAGVTVAGRPARLVATFGEGEPAELLALWGSGGRLEIAVREGSAVRDLGSWRGAPVQVAIRTA